MKNRIKLSLGLLTPAIVAGLPIITTSCARVVDNGDLWVGSFKSEPLMEGQLTTVKITASVDETMIEDPVITNVLSYDKDICEVVSWNNDTFVVKGIKSGYANFLIKAIKVVGGKEYYGVWKQALFVNQKNTMIINKNGIDQSFDLLNSIDPNCFCVCNPDGTKKDFLTIPLANGEERINLTWNGDEVTYSEEIVSLHLYATGNNIQVIHTHFLYGCKNLVDLDIWNAGNIITIDNFAFAKCSNFNQEIKLPKNIWNIGHFFMQDCKAYDKIIDLSPYPNLNSVNYGFMNGCDNFTSLNIGDVKTSEFNLEGVDNDNYTLSTTNEDAVMYTNGIYVTGNDVESFITRFGNLSGPQYRMLYSD